MKTTITTLMALALSVSLGMAQDKPAAAASSSSKASTSQASNDDPVVISAGDVSIHQSELESAISSLPPQYQAMAKGQGKKQFADEYLQMKLLAKKGVQAGVDKDPDVVQQVELMKQNLIANKELSDIEKDIKVSDADLQKAYDDHKSEYEQVKARHILIAFKGSPAAQPKKPELSDAEAKAKAEGLRAKIVGGADFAEVAKAESDDVGSGANGGDLGSFGHGQMVPEFEKAAFETKVGEVSPVIRSEYGYHIIKVEAHDSTPFAQVKPKLERDERQKKVQAAIDALKDNAKPKYDDTYFAAAAAPAAMNGDGAAAAAAAASAKPATDSAKPSTKKPADTKKPGTDKKQ